MTPCPVYIYILPYPDPLHFSHPISPAPGLICSLFFLYRNAYTGAEHDKKV